MLNDETHPSVSILKRMPTACLMRRSYLFPVVRIQLNQNRESVREKAKRFERLMHNEQPSPDAKSPPPPIKSKPKKEHRTNNEEKRLAAYQRRHKKPTKSKIVSVRTTTTTITTTTIEQHINATVDDATDNDDQRTAESEEDDENDDDDDDLLFDKLITDINVVTNESTVRQSDNAVGDDICKFDRRNNDADAPNTCDQYEDDSQIYQNLMDLQLDDTFIQRAISVTSTR